MISQKSYGFNIFEWQKSTFDELCDSCGGASCILSKEAAAHKQTVAAVYKHMWSEKSFPLLFCDKNKNRPANPSAKTFSFLNQKKIPLPPMFPLS